MPAALASPNRIKKKRLLGWRRASSQRLPGQRADAESGLNYNYFRDYEAGSGRYVESDPIGLSGGISTYLYVKAHPLSYSDAGGLCPCPGGTWTQERFDFGISIAFGGYLAVNKAHVSCDSNPNVSASLRQTTIAGGLIIGVGSGWSFSGKVFGVSDSAQFEGWSTNQCFGGFSIFSISAPCGRPGGGSAGAGPGIGGGVAWGSTYTHIIRENCPRCGTTQ